MLESALSKFHANHFEFLLTFKKSFDWCKYHVANRIKHYKDKGRKPDWKVYEFQSWEQKNSMG